MKLFSQMSRPLLSLGLKVRSRNWPEDYYIYRKDETLMDSMGNIFAHSWQEFFANNQHILNNSGHVWEIYEEVEYNNL